MKLIDKYADLNSCVCWIAEYTKTHNEEDRYMIDWIHDTRDEFGRCLIIIHGSKGKKTYLVNYGWTVEDAKKDYERWDGESCLTRFSTFFPSWPRE